MIFQQSFAASPIDNLEMMGKASSLHAISLAGLDRLERGMVGGAHL
jgi:hypothetical protein